MRSSMLCALALAVTSTVMAQTTTTTTTTRESSPATVDHVTTQTTHTTTEHVVTETTQLKEISTPDQSRIVANVLCQNVPTVKTPEAAVTVYSNYIEEVSKLFADNSQDIKSNTIGINNDSQMSYTLNSPVNIVGIAFNTVNINTLKGQNGNDHQITATKPLQESDKGLLKSIPQDDNLTVSTTNQKLEIICNVKIPMEK